jgi:ATP-binding cassette subfamily B protein
MTVLARKVLPYLWPYRWQFLWALIQIFLISGCELIKPWPFKVIMDNILGKKPLPWHFVAAISPQMLLLLSCIGIVLTYLLAASLNLLNNYTTVNLGQSLVNDLRADLYNHLQRLSLAFHSLWSVRDLIYRVTNDTYAIQTLSTNGLLSIISTSLLLLGMFIILLSLDTHLTLLALSACPVLLLVLSPLNGWVTSAAHQARQQESAVYMVVQRAMSAIRLIQAFTKEEEEIKNL